MLVQDFARLIAIWKLAERDRSTREIRLYPNGVAHVRAIHSEAVRRGAPLPIDGPVAVDGAVLAGVPLLFPPDKEIKLSATGASLIVECGRRRAMLARIAVSEQDEPPAMVDGFKGRDFGALRGAMPLLTATTAMHAIDPVTSGIRFRREKGGLALAATDRSSVASLVTVGVNVKGAKEDRIVPAADLATALSLLDGDIGIVFDKDLHAVLRDETTLIRLSLLQGVFPDLAQLPAKKTLKRRIALPLDAVHVAARAAALIDADRIMSINVKDGRGAITVQSETGGFRVPIGKQAAPDCEIAVSSSLLIDAVVPLGKDIVLRYGDDPRSMLIFEGLDTGYLLWMAPIVQ